MDTKSEHADIDKVEALWNKTKGARKNSRKPARRMIMKPKSVEKWKSPAKSAGLSHFSTDTADFFNLF
jgi:hypothetical protein